MTTSAQRWRATSTGMLRTMPPSERICFPTMTGANAPGMAMLARIAVAMSPLSSTTILSADHVGGDGAVRYRQLVEVALHARAGHVGAQQVFDAAGVHEAAGHDDAALADAELELVAVGDALALLLDRLEVAAALSTDDGLPVDPDQERLQFVGRNAGGVTRADQRAHAGAGDAVDRHVHLLEHLQHADVGAALGAAAGQHEPDAWAGRVGTRGSRACLSGGRRSCATQGDQCKKCRRQAAVGRRSEAHVDLHFNRSALVVDGILTIPPNADGLTCSFAGRTHMAGLVPEWIVSAFAVATVFVVMFSVGLDMNPRDFVRAWGRPALMLKSLFAVLVAVPVITLVTAWALQLPRAAEVGMVVMAIAPGAPIALRRSLAAGADRDFAPGLQVTIALLAVISMPLSLALLDELYAASATISPWHLLRQVLLAQFLPLALGVGLGQMHGPAAAWLRPRLARAGRWLLGALALLAIFGFWSVLIATGLRVASAIVLTTLAALAVGHVLGGPNPATRTAVAISTALRNPGLALLAAALNSAPPGVKATILTCLVVTALTVTPYAIWRSRYS